MPIYEYFCNSCGVEKEHLQKISDAPIAVCPVCGGDYVKRISAAGFQLKGSGWYVTDFRGNNNKPAAGKTESGATAASAACGSGTGTGTGKTDGATAAAAVD